MLSQKLIIKVCAVIMAISGVVIIFSTIYPIVSYEWEATQRYPILISPLVDEDTASFKFSNRDYTSAGNWFDGVQGDGDFVVSDASLFTVTIAKLGIYNAVVIVGGEDLSESLIQYPKTAPPGKIGNTVIFGHSILPLYYDPKNYLAIFSTLPTLESGDVINVDYDEVSYEYIVEDMFEVKPKDIQIMEQHTSLPYLTLVTCTPPGHPLKPKRLVVRAKLVPAKI
jgi:sortase A